MLLRVVADGNVVAERHGAAISDDLSGEDAQEAGLAGTVQSEHEQALTAPEVERDVAEHRRPAIRLGESVDLDHGATRGRRRRELDTQDLVPPWAVHLDGLQPGDALLHAVGRRRLGGLRSEPVDEALHPRHFLLLAGGELHQPLLVGGSGGAVLGVGALVLDEVADGVLRRPVEVQHAGDRFVE